MRILIIRPAALGDTLMLAPALCGSRDWGEVIVAGRKPGIDFLRPLVSGCLDFEDQGWHSLFMDVSEPGVDLPLREADRVVAFLKDPKGGVKKKLESFFPRASIAVLPGYPDEKDAVHVAFYLARRMEENGLPVHAEAAVGHALSRPILPYGHRRRERIIFHPGSGGTRKNHPPEFWINLLRAFRKKALVAEKLPVILLGPAEEGLLPFFSDKGKGGVLLSPDREELTLLLQESRLYVGQDSGITHLAAMAGVPTIALFRCSSVAQWSPLGPKVKVIETSSGGPELLEETLKAAQGFLNENATAW